jgi:hypothetical protein
MWKTRLAGAIIALAGAATFAFVFYQGLKPPVASHLMFAIGMPGALLIAMASLIAFVFGVHLTVAPRTAARRWTPGIRRRR